MNKKTWIIVIILLIVVVGIVWWISSRPTTYAPAGPAPAAAPVSDSPQAIQQELEAVNLEDVDGAFQSIDADLNTL